MHVQRSEVEHRRRKPLQACPMRVRKCAHTRQGVIVLRGTDCQWVFLREAASFGVAFFLRRNRACLAWHIEI